MVIFGAGATKACGGPLTNEILPFAFENSNIIEREDYLALLHEFLSENFHVRDFGLSGIKQFPPLPLLVGLVDIALDRKHSLGGPWNPEKLQTVRKALEYSIFAVLEFQLRRLQNNYYQKLLGKLYAPERTEPNVISLNYDIIADNTLMNISEMERGFAFPDFGCDISTEKYKQAEKFGKLYKIHGSLNWLYCPACHRLDLGTSESGRRTVKALNLLYIEEQNLSYEQGGGDLKDRYTCHGSPCRDCGTDVIPVMISPTHLKDYRNPHITSIWYGADRLLRQAKRVFIIGYSMPPDDVDVIYLLKRGLSGVDARDITVVEYDDQNRPAEDHPVGQNYCKLFGPEIDWHNKGFEDFVNTYPF